jgi:glycosyltransferase involved in cell wall biosynthesis
MVKRILIVTDNLQDQINGVVTTFKNIEALAVLDGYSVLYLDPSQFTHFDCPGYPEVKISFPWQVGKKIKAINPDHIHIATEGPIGFAARCWLDRNGKSYNSSYHTKFPDFLKKIYKVPTSWTYAYLRWFHKNSKVVLTTTQTMVQDLIDHKFKSNIISWTRGVDTTYLKSNITKRDGSVLYVGRVSKEKGLDDLCCLYDDFKIVVVGDGPYRKTLQKKYPKVRFVGYKTGSELADYYKKASVFCFPSKVDTFGIVIIEALSQGTPVAAYKVPGPIDILEQNVTGVMGTDLKKCIISCYRLNHGVIQQKSQKWTWQQCWDIFKENLSNI